jgi:hypothetical protein
VLGQVQWANDQRQAALDSLEHSISLLKDHNPYETARTKAEWGRVLAVTDPRRAMALLRAAHATFQELDAQRDRHTYEQILNS